VIIFNNTGTVTKANNVVTDTKRAAYSFSISKLSANIEVIAEAGIAVIIITVFTAFEFCPANKNRLFVNSWGGIFLNPAPLLFLPLFLCYD